MEGNGCNLNYIRPISSRRSPHPCSFVGPFKKLAMPSISITGLTYRDMATTNRDQYSFGFRSHTTAYDPRNVWTTQLTVTDKPHTGTTYGSRSNRYPKVSACISHIYCGSPSTGVTFGPLNINDFVSRERHHLFGLSMLNTLSYVPYTRGEKY